MGVGDPLEVPFTLRGPLPAGAWGIIGDGTALEACDVRFDVLWRRGQGSGAVDMTIVSFQHHFEPPTDVAHHLDPIAYEDRGPGVAVASAPGDLLMLRFSIASQHAPTTRQFVPNADGEVKDARIPNISPP